MRMSSLARASGECSEATGSGSRRPGRECAAGMYVILFTISGKRVPAGLHRRPCPRALGMEKEVPTVCSAHRGVRKSGRGSGPVRRSWSRSRWRAEPRSARRRRHRPTARPGRRRSTPSTRRAASTRWLWGSDYRALWTAPFEVEVLDLQSFAGGLTPVRRVGGQQTKGLAMKGKDGRDYTFRSIDKDPTEILPEDLRDTWVKNVVVDQMAPSTRASPLVADELMKAAGVLRTEQRLFVMPDDPALGDYRKDFAGVVGTVYEFVGAKSDRKPRLPGRDRGPEARGVLRASPGRARGPGRRPRVPEGAPLRHPHRRLGPPPRSVALAQAARPGTVAADARRPRPGVLALRRARARPRPRACRDPPELRRRLPRDEGAHLERLGAGPRALGRPRAARLSRNWPPSSSPRSRTRSSSGRPAGCRPSISRSTASG